VRNALKVVAICLLAGLAIFGCRRTLELGFSGTDASAQGSDDPDGGGGHDTHETDSVPDASILDGSVRIP
jgi:hypothetical protein